MPFDHRRARNSTAAGLFAHHRSVKPERQYHAPMTSDRRDFIRQLAALVAAAGGQIWDRRKSSGGPDAGSGRSGAAGSRRQSGRHAGGAAHDARRGHRAQPRSDPEDRRRQHDLRLQPRVRRRPAQSRRTCSPPITASLLGSAHPQPAARLGQAARSVLQGHDAAPSGRRRVVRSSRSRSLRGDAEASAGARHEGLRRAFSKPAGAASSTSRRSRPSTSTASRPARDAGTIPSTSGSGARRSRICSEATSSTASSGAPSARVRSRTSSRTATTRAPRASASSAARRGKNERASIPSAHGRGSRILLVFVQGLRANQLKPADGAAAGFLRILIRYPEVLAWDYQYRLSREAVMKTMYDQVKAIKPSAPVGWHVDHWATTMDIIARSAMSYADMAPWSDYLKVVVYHAVTGPRDPHVGGERAAQRAERAHARRSADSSLRPLRLRQDADAEVERADETRHVAGLRLARDAARSVASAEGRRRSIRASASTCPAPPTTPTPSIEVVKAVRGRRQRRRRLARVRRDDGAESHGVRARRARGREDRVTQSRSTGSTGSRWVPTRSSTRGSSARSTSSSRDGGRQCRDAVQPRLQRRADQVAARSCRSRRAAHRQRRPEVSAGVGAGRTSSTTRTRRCAIRSSTTTFEHHDARSVRGDWSSRRASAA